MGRMCEFVCMAFYSGGALVSGRVLVIPCSGQSNLLLTYCFSCGWKGSSVLEFMRMISVLDAYLLWSCALLEIVVMLTVRVCVCCVWFRAFCLVGFSNCSFSPHIGLQRRLPVISLGVSCCPFLGMDEFSFWGLEWLNVFCFVESFLVVPRALCSWLGFLSLWKNERRMQDRGYLNVILLNYVYYSDSSILERTQPSDLQFV